jgi:hypothetical protein
VVHAEITEPGGGATSSFVATSSFDIFMKENGKYKFRGVFIPSQGEGKSYIESRLRYGDKNMKDIMLDFPLSANISELYIGLREGSELLPATPYKYTKPIVFYGSSIVHGEGAMRPGNTYPAIISRKLDTDFINLGFRGNATAEEAMMKYIAGIPMSFFVYDYDYNAPSIEHLEKTHYAGYEIFREKQPKTPVIFASRVDYYEGDIASNEKRRNIIKESYFRALAAGDRNVYFIDGSKIYPPDKRDECTADSCHPNDMGYSYMADAFGEIIKTLIEK